MLNFALITLSFVVMGYCTFSVQVQSLASNTYRFRGAAGPSQLRRRVGGWKVSVFQKLESWPGPRAARISSFTARTSGLASSYSVIGTLGIYEPSSCNSSGVESFRLPWHRSPVSCATTDLVFRYAVKVIVAIIRDHKSVKRGTLVLTEGR